MRALAVMIRAIVTLVLFLTLGSAHQTSAQDFEGIDGPLGPRSGTASLRDRQDAASSQLRALNCDGAITVAVGSEAIGSTVGLPAQQDSYGCGDELETGPELVYFLELTEPTWLEITLESDADLDLILLNECEPVLGCLALGDVGVRSVRPVIGSYYIVVDGYAGAEDDFTLSVTELVEAEIPEDLCPAPVAGKTMRSLSGDWTTCNHSSTVDALLCSYSVTGGRESDFLLFLLEAGGSIHAEVTQNTLDLAIYLVGGCGAATQCLAFADENFAGGNETLQWTNPDTVARPVYLFVDTVGGPDDCGEFHIDIQADVTVRASEGSWSALKAWFGSQGGER